MMLGKEVSSMLPTERPGGAERGAPDVARGTCRFSECRQWREGRQ